MPFFDAFIWILIGLVIGSFVNVCIDRLPLQLAEEEVRSKLLKSPKLSSFMKILLQDRILTLSNPTRSFCFYCGHQLKWFENIPMISYILIKGHCRKCKVALVPRMFWTEVLHGFWYGIFSWFSQNWIWTLLAGINFSFLWILTYCRSYKQVRNKLFNTGGILLMAVNFLMCFFIKE